MCKCQCKHSGITKSDFLSFAPACVFLFFPLKMSLFTHNDLDLSVRVTGAAVKERAAQSVRPGIILAISRGQPSAFVAACRSLRGSSEWTHFHSCWFIHQQHTSLSAAALNYAWRLGCGWLLLHTPL